MAKETVQLDQGQLLKRLERLEQQLAKRGQRRGGGAGTALKAFTVGALVGGGAALLYAPQRGEQIRRQLRQRGSQVTEQATAVAGQARQAAGQLTDQARQAISQGTDQVQAATMRPASGAPAPPAPAASAGSPPWPASPPSELERG